MNDIDKIEAVREDFVKWEARNPGATLWDAFKAGKGINPPATATLELAIIGAVGPGGSVKFTAPMPTPPEVAADRDTVRALIAVHAAELGQNEYAYFELAYTRQTGWMAWICSNHHEVYPNRKVIAQGQGHTPDEACRDAMAALAAKGA